MEPAAADADLPPGRASPRQGCARMACAALLASTVLENAKKAEGAPHWGPPLPSMKNISKPATQHNFTVLIDPWASEVTLGCPRTCRPCAQNSAPVAQTKLVHIQDVLAAPRHAWHALRPRRRTCFIILDSDSNLSWRARFFWCVFNVRCHTTKVTSYSQFDKDVITEQVACWRCHHCIGSCNDDPPTGRRELFL